MAINTTWSSPASAGGAGGIDLATGDTLSETVWDRTASDLYRLGGTDGNAKTGKYQIGTATSYSNANNTAGLTINQGAADDEIVSCKSSDVAHGMTTSAETDTFLTVTKLIAASGGATLRGFSAGTRGLQLEGWHTTDDTNKSVGGVGALYVNGLLKSGTSATGLGANANIIAFATNSTTRFILDADGDSHEDVGTAWTNFDAYDDAALLNSLAAAVARPDDPIKEEFRSWLTYNREALTAARLVTFNDDGHHFVNMSKLTMLLVGAVRQQAERLRILETRLLPA